MHVLLDILRPWHNRVLEPKLHTIGAVGRAIIAAMNAFDKIFFHDRVMVPSASEELSSSKCGLIASRAGTPQ